MKGKVVSPQGKEVEMTENLEDLAKHLYEDYDLLRAGTIEVKDALARAMLGRTVVSIRTLMFIQERLLSKKPDSKFLGMDKSKELKA